MAAWGQKHPREQGMKARTGTPTAALCSSTEWGCVVVLDPVPSGDVEQTSLGDKEGANALVGPLGCQSSSLWDAREGGEAGMQSSLEHLWSPSKGSGSQSSVTVAPGIPV